MKWNKKNIIIFSIFLCLLVCTAICMFMYIRAGAKEKKIARSFLDKLYNESMIDIYPKDDLGNVTKQSDPLTHKTYYSITIGSYGISVDKDLNVIGFSNSNASALNNRINEDEAVSLAKGYIEKIYDGECEFYSVNHQDKAKEAPYYTIIFSKLANGYQLYGYDLSLNINKQTGMLDGYANPNVNKDIGDITINVDKDEAFQKVFEEFNTSYKDCTKNKIDTAFYCNSDDKQMELCYIIEVSGNDEEENDIKMRYFVSTENGEIKNNEKITVSNTIA